MPVDFPPDPNIGDTAVSSLGIIWTFDGIAWRTGDFRKSENSDKPKTFLIASSSGLFGYSGLSPNIFCGGDKGQGWNSTSWNIPFPQDGLIPIEYSNVGIPIPVDLPTGSEIRLCGKATNEGGICDGLYQPCQWIYLLGEFGGLLFNFVGNDDNGNPVYEDITNLGYYIRKFQGMIVSSAGSSEVNNSYFVSGASSGRPQYTSQDLEINIFWDGSQWVIINNSTLDELYYSGENVATPDLVTTWIETNGDLPLPEFTPFDLWQIQSDDLIISGGLGETPCDVEEWSNDIQTYIPSERDFYFDTGSITLLGIWTEDEFRDNPIYIIPGINSQFQFDGDFWGVYDNDTEEYIVTSTGGDQTHPWTAEWDDLEPIQIVYDLGCLTQFYHGLGIFNCDDLFGDENIWYYQISPLTFSFTPFQVLQNNTEEGPTYSEACFSLTYTTTSPINKCNNYIVVALGDSFTEEEEKSTTKFTWTLNATTNPTEDCCEGPIRLSGAGLTAVNGIYYLVDLQFENFFFPDDLFNFSFGWNGQSLMLIGLTYSEDFNSYLHLILVGDLLLNQYFFVKLTPTPNFTPCFWNNNWDLDLSQKEFDPPEILPIPTICGNAFSTECQIIFSTYSNFGQFGVDDDFILLDSLGDDVYDIYINLTGTPSPIPEGFIVGSVSYSIGSFSPVLPLVAADYENPVYLGTASISEESQLPIFYFYDAERPNCPPSIHFPFNYFYYLVEPEE
jgi:hypothetical protein